MGLVEVMLSSLLGDEEDFVKEKKRSLALCTVDVEGSLEDELAVCSEVGSFPVDEQGLDLLQEVRHVFP